jgi:hypothetical protein
MLRNVLEDYLKSIKDERLFDPPFLSLLPAIGFTDVRHTHGGAEFGKDFIAKRNNRGGQQVQYSFQLKAGDVDQPFWREKVQGQMLEALMTPWSHPHFDADLRHQSVLVVTGKLTGNAGPAIDGFNEQLKKMDKLPIKVWEQPCLIDALASHGLEGVHRATAADYAAYGRFYSVYGKSVQGTISEREIEGHSNSWIEGPGNATTRMLIAAVEAESIAARCSAKGLAYEGLKAHLGLLRAAMHALFVEKSPERAEHLKQLNRLALEVVRRAAGAYIAEVRADWVAAGKNLMKLLDGAALIVTYPVLCARVVEVAGLLYFLEEKRRKRKEVAEFLGELVASEPGCGHPVGDRYAVSLVPAVLALLHGGRVDVARDLLRRATVWLCDRQENGSGLAPLEATAYAEVATLIGYPFAAVAVGKHPNSFLATVLSDLSAFAGDPQLYEAVVHDVLAVEIVPQYWQAQDTEGQFSVGADDVIQYPTALDYKEEYTAFEAREFATHIRSEPEKFRLTDSVSPSSYLGLILLLRDRYFPTLWPLLANSGVRRRRSGTGRRGALT